MGTLKPVALFWSKLRKRFAARPAAAGSEIEPLLSLVPKGFTVVLDVTLRGSLGPPVHLVAGPTGLFVVQPKPLPGPVEIRNGVLWHNGKRRANVVQRAWRGAVAVQELMSQDLAEVGIEAQPLLCIVGAELPWARSRIEGVAVVDTARVARDIATRPVSLEDPQVLRLRCSLERILNRSLDPVSP